MLDGTLDKLWAIIGGCALFWAGSVEKRLGNRVTAREFNGMREDVKWLQSAVWDIMVAKRIKSSLEPPDEIKKLNDGNKRGS